MYVDCFGREQTLAACEELEEGLLHRRGEPCRRVHRQRHGAVQSIKACIGVGCRWIVFITYCIGGIILRCWAAIQLGAAVEWSLEESIKLIVNDDTTIIKDFFYLYFIIVLI